VSRALRAWTCALCDRRKVAFGGPDTTPPRGFAPEGWIEIGSDDLCPEHVEDGRAYERELELWFERRRAWESQHPRPIAPWNDQNNGVH
jgi:hypothetical protein